MQRARRRFVCSAASLSSFSNTSLRPRGRSRTSSAAGDGLAVNRDFTTNVLLTEVKPKLRSTKYNMRLLSSSQKNLKKFSKTKKAMKPPVNCFQNAIVIAPFHTLKKCFQSKLVDIYSMEKMKKINHKMRMAKKQNMSFEYEVIELDKVGAKVKTEKGKKAPKKPKERASSYCQCDKASRKKPARETFDPPEPPTFSTTKSKRRRLNSPLFMPTTLKAEIDPRIFSCTAVEPFRKSDMSMTRSGDSWESLSNSPSIGGEHLEGTIAISTTSFDSCFEQFDRESCSYLGPEQYSRRKVPREERIDAEYIPRPANDSRHMIMNDGIKSSDGNIADFMDREPQTQDIALDLEQHLKPLRRQSKSKIKKPGTGTAEYYLRSKSPSKEKLFPDQSRLQMSLENGGSGGKKRNVQMEAATQVESNGSAESEVREDEQAGKDNHPSETEAEPGENITQSEKPETPETEKKDAEEVAEATVLEDSNEPIQIDLLSHVEEDLMIQPKETSEPQESDFIFGARNFASRLGESCEFTFGLNWILSDDETSEHGEGFY